VNMKLELVPVPVSDVDAAKDFYVEKVGFAEDLDVRPRPGMRVVQLTPAGSACSIVIGTGMPQIAMDPGSIRGLHLVVGDVSEAREALTAQGVELSDIEDQGQGVKYAWFSDPDGNTWTLQEMPWKSPEFG
jgi:catechol 2,3-dioxygenase-like lactoylglutathione lyase family enzyme